MSMIADVKKYLNDNGVTTPIYLSYIPAEGECIALYQYTGQPPLLKANLERPGLQVKAMYTDYETAISKIEEIASVLNTLGNEFNDTGEAVTINGTLYQRIQPAQSATSLGWNEGNQIEIVQNFYVTKEIK